MNIVLKNITVSDRRSDIFVSEGVIKRIAPAGGILPEGCETVDCSGKTAVPGFVNMHTHAAMTLMRGVGEDIQFSDWIERIWRLEASQDEDFIYWGTKIACVEMLRTGTTAFNDHYWFPTVGMRAATEMGLRPTIAYVLLDNGDKAKAARQREECQRMFEESRSWGGARFSVGVHAVYSVSEENIAWAAEFAKDNGLMFHCHLAETRKEDEDCKALHGGLSPVGYMDRLGALTPGTVAAHTLWLSDKDIEILGRRGVSCVHNVNSNLKISSGYRFLYNELRDAGANICIGTDGCASSNNLDMLEAMKTSAILQKAWRGDPSAMPLGELLQAATLNGARAMGLNSGEIAEGRDADILIIDTNSTFFISPGDFLGNLVYSAHSDCIESVMVKGRFLMKDRRIEGEEEILREARRIINR